MSGPTASPQSLPLLTLFGGAALIGANGSVALPLKYQKGQALLAYLSCQPGKVLRREMLADLLWPDLDAAGGRANLRVVLSDVQACLHGHGLEGVLQTQRDWIQFSPEDRVLTDGGLAQRELRALLTPSQEQLWYGCRSQRWLPMAKEAGLSDEFAEWLAAQRPLLEPETRPDCVAPHSQGRVQAFPEVAPVAVLRLDFTWATQAREDDEALVRVAAMLAALVAEAASLGGQCLRHDDAGAVYLFGASGQGPGRKHNAVRFACRLPGCLPEGVQVQAGLTWGRLLLTAAPALQASGWPLRLAERLAITSEPGYLVCDQSCADLAHVLPLESLGALEFKEFSTRFDVFRLNLRGPWASSLPGAGNARSPLVGRSDVLQHIRGMWSDVARHACSSSLLLHGAVGVGKTRVAYEVARELRAHGGQVLWLGGWPESADESWAAVRELFITHTQGAGPVALRVAQSVWQWPRNPDEWARHAVADLIENRQVSVALRPALLNALACLLAPRSGMASLVVIDDMPWVDESSLGLLWQVAQQEPGVLWLLTTRAGDVPSDVEARASSFPNLQQWPLKGLADAEAQQLLMLMSSPDGVSATENAADRVAKVQRQVQDAGGLPLYLLYEASAQADHFAELCHALLRQLGEDRWVMGVAATLGLSFRISDLTALCGPDATTAALTKAVVAQLVIERDGLHMAFSHAALRDHLLQMKPREEALHHARLAAQVFEHRAAFVKAAQLREQAGEQDLARQDWWLAVQKALSADDQRSACAHFEHLARLGHVDAGASEEQRLQMQLLHARVLVATLGYGHVRVHIMLRDLDLAPAHELTDPHTRFAYVALLYLGSSSQGRLDGLARATHLCGLSNTPQQEVMATWARGNTLWWMGEFHEARRWLLRNAEVAEKLPVEHRMAFFPSDPAVFARAELAWVHGLMGDGEASAQCVDQARQLAQASPTRQDLCVFHCMTAFLCWNQGDVDQLAAHAQQSMAVAEAESFSLWQGVAGLQWELAQALKGAAPDMGRVQQCSDLILSGYQAGLTTGQWMVADLLRASGQGPQALAVVQDILTHVDEREHRYCLMDIWRIRAQVLVGLGEHAAAQAAWAQSQHIAREAGLLGWLKRWQSEVVV